MRLKLKKEYGIQTSILQTLLYEVHMSTVRCSTAVGKHITLAVCFRGKPSRRIGSPHQHVSDLTCFGPNTINSKDTPQVHFFGFPEVIFIESIKIPTLHPMRTSDSILSLDIKHDMASGPDPLFLIYAICRLTLNQVKQISRLHMDGI